MSTNRIASVVDIASPEPVRALAPAVAPAAADPGDRQVLVVVRRRQPLGVLVVQDRQASWTAVGNRQLLTAGGLALAGCAVAGAAWALGRRAARPAGIRTITMGPGGWVSMKNVVPKHGIKRQERRPWWAVALRAHRLDT